MNSFADINQTTFDDKIWWNVH